MYANITLNISKSLSIADLQVRGGTGLDGEESRGRRRGSVQITTVENGYISKHDANAN